MTEFIFSWVYLGFAIFTLGGFARIYMVIRLNGLKGILSSQKRLTTSYYELTKEQEAPLWPLVMSVTFLPVGIVIVLGAILWSR